MLIVLLNRLTTARTYQKIDKENGAEAKKYDLPTESHLHSWGPKLAARSYHFNMNLDNAYKY
jgi:hypothetical protein